MQILINMEFLTFHYGNAKTVMFYCITHPLSIYLSLSVHVNKPGHLGSIYDYEHLCQHWKGDTDSYSTWWASGLFDYGHIINLSIFNKILQGNTILEVNKCIPRINVCLEQQNTIVGFVQNGIKSYKNTQNIYVIYFLNTS